MSAIAILLIFFTAAFTYQGFKRGDFYDKYVFDVDAILIRKEYIRLISSGFLHGSWLHFAFNMLTLYSFAPIMEETIGMPLFLALYFFGLIGGNLFALYYHKNHGSYRAVGASGAVFGVLFAFISYFPTLKISPFLLPKLYAWIWGLVFVLLTIWGIRKQKGNIGHEAHLGGGLAGLIAAACINLGLISDDFTGIVILAMPSLIFLVIMSRSNYAHLIDNQEAPPKTYTFEDQYNERRANKQQEIDRILEKIKKKGVESLTEAEKKILDS